MRVKALVPLNKASRCGSRVSEGTEEKVKLSCFFYYYNYILDFYYLFHFFITVPGGCADIFPPENDSYKKNFAHYLLYPREKQDELKCMCSSYRKVGKKRSIEERIFILCNHIIDASLKKRRKKKTQFFCFLVMHH